jgi:hypothetical protein
VGYQRFGEKRVPALLGASLALDSFAADDRHAPNLSIQAFVLVRAVISRRKESA